MNINRAYRKIFVSLMAFGLLAAFFLPRNFFQNERPPTLELDSQSYQGFIGGDIYFMRFEQSDLERLNLFENAKERNSNIQYYYSDNNLNFLEIIHSIKPDLENQCIVITFRADEQKFYTFPKGPFLGTETLEKSQLNDFYVPAGDPIIIACSNPTATINIQHGSEQPMPFANNLNLRPSSWNLTVFSSDAALKQAVHSCYNRVQSIWVQNDQNHFVETTVDDPKLAEGYYFAWLNLRSQAGECRTKSNSADPGSDSANQASDGGGSQNESGQAQTIYDYLNQNYDVEDDSRLHQR